MITLWRLAHNYERRDQGDLAIIWCWAKQSFKLEV